MTENEEDELQDYSDPKNWKYSSDETPGLQEVVNPDNSSLMVTWSYRLNLKPRTGLYLFKEHLELNGVVINGKAMIRKGSDVYYLNRFDSFYLPGNQRIEVAASDEDLVMYIGGGPWHGEAGSFFTRKFDLSLPLGDIHQIHGKAPYRREVFMTLAQQDAANSLICGLTFGDEGGWTSWPPHQHSEHLEEVYCYFDLPKPRYALHLSSRKPGMVEAIHQVSSGDYVAIPEGYHPTVSIPGNRSCYFWIMSAHSKKSRRYDLAVNDPGFE